MKQFLLFLPLFLLTVLAAGQVQDPVTYQYSAKKNSATTYEIHITATIEQGWHIYSQTTPSGGPLPTVLHFTINPLLVLNGSIREIGKLEQHFEKLFDTDVKQFSDKVDFVQKITLKKAARTKISGSVEYMSCNDHQCLPPSKKTFSIDLN